MNLFGFLHKKASDANKTYSDGSKTVSTSIVSFDQWLYEKNSKFSTNENHQNVFRTHTDKSMTTYIRNYIDHPGEDSTLPSGKKRLNPTMEEIKNSIDNMLNILKNEFNINT